MDRFRARVVAPQGSNSLAVEWILPAVEGQLTIGGPNLHSIPVDAVPLDLRRPQSEFWVEFNSNYEVEAVKPIEK